MPTTVPRHIQLRRGTATQWHLADPILRDGEPGVQLGAAGVAVKLKIGDGVTDWDNLPYISDSFVGSPASTITYAMIASWNAGTGGGSGVVVESDPVFLASPASGITALNIADWNSKQPGDSDLTDIAALTPANDDIIQRKSGAWTNRTMSQLMTDLGALGTSLTSAHIFVGNGANVATNVAMSGDTTISNTGAVTIANDAVTLAKMANMATASLIYRKTAGIGDPEVNTVATLKTDLSLTGTNSGDVTLAGQNYITISGQVITAAAVNLSGSHVTGNLGVSHLDSGISASIGTFWRGDGRWASLPGGGDILSNGTVNFTATETWSTGGAITSRVGVGTFRAANTTNRTAASLLSTGELVLEDNTSQPSESRFKTKRIEIDWSLVQTLNSVPQLVLTCIDTNHTIEIISAFAEWMTGIATGGGTNTHGIAYLMLYTNGTTWHQFQIDIPTSAAGFAMRGCPEQCDPAQKDNVVRGGDVYVQADTDSGTGGSNLVLYIYYREARTK